MARKKRTKTKKVYTTPDGEVIEEIYCRRCQKYLPPRLFYEALDENLDKNGYMSVCKDCISDIFELNFNTEGSLSGGVLKTCRMLNVAYMQPALDATETWIDNSEKNGASIRTAFGFYKGKVSIFARLNPGTIKTFEEPIQEIEESGDDIDEENHDLVEFWGENLEMWEYEFLENELREFKKTHKADTYAEIVLLKQVCFILLEIDKNRKAKKSTATLQKQLQDMMKSLNISPNQANIKNANKSMEAFGNWVKDIEELEPAEWHKDKELFKDVDNLTEYFQNYFVRPIKNFVTGSRDFKINESGEIEEINEELFDDEEELV